MLILPFIRWRFIVQKKTLKQAKQHYSKQISSKHIYLYIYFIYILVSLEKGLCLLAGLKMGIGTSGKNWGTGVKAILWYLARDEKCYFAHFFFHHKIMKWPWLSPNSTVTKQLLLALSVFIWVCFPYSGKYIQSDD